MKMSKESSFSILDGPAKNYASNKNGNCCHIISGECVRALGCVCGIKRERVRGCACVCERDKECVCVRERK